MRIRKIFCNDYSTHYKYGNNTITIDELKKLFEDGKVWHAFCSSRKSYTLIQYPTRVYIEKTVYGSFNIYILVTDRETNKEVKKYVNFISNSINSIFTDSEESCQILLNKLIKQKINIRERAINLFEIRQRSVINRLKNEMKV